VRLKNKSVIIVKKSLASVCGLRTFCVLLGDMAQA